jgi:hypothetical protein
MVRLRAMVGQRAFCAALVVLAIPAGMVVWLALIWWLVAPAHADTSRMSIDVPTGPCFAVVVIENRAGVYNRDEALQTDQGLVVVRYQTVGGHNETDADLVDVVSLPDGVMADPMHIALPDGDTGRICLMEWLGG